MPKIITIMSVGHKNHSCPKCQQLELFYLTTSRLTKYQKIYRHLLKCPSCSKKMDRIKTFYKILNAELDQPIAPATLDFCKRVATKGTRYGLLICSPCPQQNNNHGKAYLSKLAFSVNGTVTKKKLKDFKLPKGNIGIMLYSDPKLGKILLFPCNADQHSFSHWNISIPGVLENTPINDSGTVKIDLMNFESLNNLLFYFTPAPPCFSKKPIVKKIQLMLAS